MLDEYTFNGWACVDCLILLANGEDPVGSMSEDEITAWHADIDRETAGFNITLGMRREDHACATNYTVTDASGDHDYRADNADDAFSQHEFSASWIGRIVERRTPPPKEIPGQLALDGTQADIPAGVTRELVTFEGSDYPAEKLTITEHELTTVQDNGGECDCETNSFSWSACDVCGSNLGGERHAVAFWKILAA